MTAAEFDLLFYKNIEAGMKPQDAFWQVNEEHEEATGRLKYADYHSYRVSKYKRLKR
jgi:hypothetical protein